MSLYLDSSVVLRIFLRQSPAISDLQSWDEVNSSQILALEASRAFDRMRLEGLLRVEDLAVRRREFEQFVANVRLVELNSGVLRRAAMPLNHVVGPLDAIHLASALIVEEQFGERPVFATHDRQQGLAAAALGFEVIGL